VNIVVASMLLGLVSCKSMACVIPSQGAFWTHDELIDNTNTTLLVFSESNVRQDACGSF